MNKEVDTYKIFKQLEERRKRRNPYTFYDKDELIDEILKLEDNLDQLNNNWNELEEWIKNENSNYVSLDSYVDGTNATYEEILDKMKEIKENNE